MIPLNDTLSPIQVKILDEVNGNAKTVKELAEILGVSATYARIQVQNLESAGRVTKLDNRMPYVYLLNTQDPAYLYENTIKEYRFTLMNDIPTENSVILGLRGVPKAQWPEYANKLVALAEAIRLLQGEGKLIDTL